MTPPWPLPDGWEWVRIEDIAQVIGGGTPRASDPSNFADEGVPWLTPADLSGYAEATIERGARDLSETGLKTSSARLLPKGAVLFTSRAPIGYCVVAANPVATNQGFKSLVLHRPVNAFLVRHYLISAKAYAEQQASGSTFLELSGSKMKRLLLPLPPTAEQQRIVDQIDALHARSAAARAALQAIPPLLDRFRQSVLAAAFRGDLTRDWRAQNPDVEPASALLERIRAERRRRWIADYAEKARARAEKRAAKKGQPWTAEDDAKALEKGRAKGAASYEAPEPVDGRELPALPTGWCWTSLEQATICHDHRRVPVRLADRRDRQGIYPYYGAFGVIDHVDDYLFDGDFVLLAEDGKNLASRTKPIALRASGKIWVNNHAHVLEPLCGVPNNYVIALLNGTDLTHLLTGIDQIKLTRKAMNQIPVPLAPSNEQTEIVRTLDECEATLAANTSAYELATRALDRLDQSILAKAFRGELVPQDPNDEPASVLLERIRAERAAAGPKKTRRGRKPRTPKPAPTPVTEPQPDLPGLTPDG